MLNKCRRKLTVSVSLGTVFLFIYAAFLLSVFPGGTVRCAASSLNERSRDPGKDLTEMSLEELMNIQITSVSKREQRASEAAAAVFVITQEDIRRSGAACIPEALRMVPGLEVAEIDSNKWAVTSRGFNDRFANKLLVLMDGRTVYTPLFSGVYWEVLDTLLEDIDRIEVIRGPGATLWGANAVNGVINIITKKAKDTLGALVSSGAGNQERGFGSVRYGGKAGDGTYYRMYAKYFNRDEAVLRSGKGAGDPWEQWRLGFRVDSERSKDDNFTVLGDVYQGPITEHFSLPAAQAPYWLPFKDDTTVSGANILTRWRHSTAADSQMTLQLYYDWYQRNDQVSYDDRRRTFDCDFQYSFSAGSRHDIVWGLGYRLNRDSLGDSLTFSFDPDRRDDQVFSGFFQDEITLIRDRLHFTLGSKFEHNDYTGFEVQPSVHLSWTPDSKNTFWGAVSRAVRTPSRAEHDAKVDFSVLPPGSPDNPLLLPVIVTALGSPDYHSEEVLVYELGYRTRLCQWATADVALFYNDYDNLRSAEMGTPYFSNVPPPLHLILPAVADNKLFGETYGAELALEWKLMPWWRIQTSYTFLQMQLHKEKASTDSFLESEERRAPHQQISVRSLIDLPANFEFDLWFRSVDGLGTSAGVPTYHTLDVRLGWKPRTALELSVVGQNLLDPQHPEYDRLFFYRRDPIEIERGVYGKITWRF